MARSIDWSLKKVFIRENLDLSTHSGEFFLSWKKQFNNFIRESGIKAEEIPWESKMATIKACVTGYYQRLNIKFLNKNNIELSYSCMPNVKFRINKQNTLRLNNSDNKIDAKQCNCRSDKNCSLNGKCCRNSIVYKVFPTTGKTDKFYNGSCETLFKLLYNNHNQCFKDNRKINSTELSKAVWKLKRSGQLPEIKWKIVQHATPYQCGSKTYNLCLSEKLQIFQADPKHH